MPQTSNQFDSLYSGNYQITINDSNGCVFILDTIINQPQAIVASFDSVASILCHGGSSGYIELIHAGGNPPFSYSIKEIHLKNSTIFSGLSAGYQNITISDSSGCTTQIDTNLYQPIPIQSIVKTQDISCFGDSTGTITVTASNGNAPYTYSMKMVLHLKTLGQLVSLSAGAYQIIVTDSNGCSLIIDTTLNEPPLLTGTISMDQDICEGDNVAITTTASGGTPPYTYLWNNNATNQSINVSPTFTSVFSVIISDSNACPYFDSCTINVTPFPVIDVLANPITGNSPLTVIFNNNTINANSYLWVL